MSYKIRKMASCDIDRVLEIESACFTNEAWSRKDFEELVGSDSDILTSLVYILDGTVSGYISSSCVLGELEIHSVAVDSNFRRRGIARALIEELERLKNPDIAFLEVRKSNVPAISLYSSLGFIEYGLRRAYYQDPQEDAMLMRKIFERK